MLQRNDGDPAELEDWKVYVGNTDADTSVDTDIVVTFLDPVLLSTLGHQVTTLGLNLFV